MGDLGLGNETFKFVDGVFEEDVPSFHMDYISLKELLMKFGLNIESIPNDLSKQILNSSSIINSISSSNIEALQEDLEDLQSKDSMFRSECSEARSEGIKIQQYPQISTKQFLRENKSKISTYRQNKVREIAMFFASLALYMSNLRKSKQSKNSSILPKINIEEDLINSIDTNALGTLEISLEDGFTTLGIKVVDDYSLQELMNSTKEEEPIKLALESEELKELKALRDSVLEKALEEKKGKPLEQGFPLTMKNASQTGFVGVSSLLVFLGILFTIVEFAMIFFKVCD